MQGTPKTLPGVFDLKMEIVISSVSLTLTGQVHTWGHFLDIMKGTMQ